MTCAARRSAVWGSVEVQGEPKRRYISVFVFSGMEAVPPDVYERGSKEGMVVSLMYLVRIQ
jgi:hypothetical protein